MAREGRGTRDGGVEDSIPDGVEAGHLGGMLE
jgi:hypothetical protein